MRVQRGLARRFGGSRSSEGGSSYSAHPEDLDVPDTLDTITADQTHRAHAVVEQVIAELKDGPLAHLPSGSYAANAAWVSMAVIAFNLARAAAVAADLRTARWATLRERLIKLPARIARTARRLDLHLPEHWPWQTNWNALWATATGPPQPHTP